MKRLKISSWSTNAILLTIGTLGGIIFSQGFSFAQWSSLGAASLVHLHASLIGASGIAVVLLAVAFRRMMGSLRRMEIRIAELEAKASVAEEPV